MIFEEEGCKLFSNDEFGHSNKLLLKKKIKIGNNRGRVSQ